MTVLFNCLLQVTAMLFSATRCLPRLDALLNVCQVVLHLLRCKSAESIAVADSNLDVVLSHLTLEALLEGENSSVYGILELQVLGVPLLQESLAIDAVLAHRGRLPGKVGATGVALEQERLARLIPSTDQERDSEWPHPTRLGVLLHNQCHPVNQLRRGDGLVVHKIVVLCHFSGPADEKSVVGAHPAVHHPNVASDLFNLVG